MARATGLGPKMQHPDFCTCELVPTCLLQLWFMATHVSAARERGDVQDGLVGPLLVRCSAGSDGGECVVLGLAESHDPSSTAEARDTTEHKMTGHQPHFTVSR